jgi:hypothetical protein
VIARSEGSTLVARFGSLVLSVLVACASATTTPQSPRQSATTPEPAIPAILALFDRYEVVAMPEAHGHKDLDDFILALVRDSHFPDKVSDIVVECGNSLYQPVLDQYIAGMDVQFTEARKAWRNTTQSMCGQSAFFELLFPLVRAINQKLPAARRLRVLGGDPPIDWDKVTTSEEARKFLDREPSIASVMEKEVLSRHRKALMLFGTFHLFHAADSAVSRYEKTYPNVTFVLSDLGIYDASRKPGSSSPFAAWPNPSLLSAQGTWLGNLALSDIIPPPIRSNSADCKVTIGFPPELQKPMAVLVDGLLYLGPQEHRLGELFPASVAIDTEYIAELQRRDSLLGFFGARSLQQLHDEVVHDAQNPMLEPPPLPDVKALEQRCRDRKK